MRLQATKRWTGLLLATTLCLALCPTASLAASEALTDVSPSPTTQSDVEETLSEDDSKDSSDLLVPEEEASEEDTAPQGDQTPLPITELRAGWNHADDGTWYWSDDGQTLRSGWLKTGGAWYYLDPTTFAMKAGEVFWDGGAWYVANASGACPASSWVKISTGWYLTGPSCAVRTGWAKVRGSWYWLDPVEHGLMATGLVDVEGSRYYLKPNGAMATGWQRLDGAWHLFASSGAQRFGWAKVGGAWYYLDPETGVMRESELFEVGGKRYLATSSGTCPSSQWVKLSGCWYLTDASCAVRTGWAKVSGTWYWLDPSNSGRMATGLFVVGGRQYVARTSGACPAREWVQVGGTWYHTNGSCEVVGSRGATVSEVVASMTLEEKVAQLFVVRPEALVGVDPYTSAGSTTKEALKRRPVGGIIYFGANLTGSRQTRSMLSNTQAYAWDVEGMPLFLCVDEEGGTVSRIGGTSGFGVANVGNMSAIGASGSNAKAQATARQIGTYVTDLGFTVDFAPVADIATSSASEMRYRSFGSSASLVNGMVRAQVRGFHEAGVMCCAKHFPGIGGATNDSHYETITSNRTLSQMLASELVPFAGAVDEGVDFVMVGHLTCKKASGSNLPASVNPYMITDVLRKRMGYDGIVITDSLGMAAVSDVYSSREVGVRVIEAGADIILMPNDFETCYQGLLSAVRSGRIAESRIDESVTRIVTAKLAYA